MDRNSRLKNAVGLCMRAGKCTSGDFAVSKLLPGGKVKLVILDSEASDNLVKQYADASAYYGFKLMQMRDAGAAIGKPERKVLAVCDANFVKLIDEAAASQEY